VAVATLCPLTISECWRHRRRAQSHLHQPPHPRTDLELGVIV
jgi:hypothetical protein